jgi:hypothetical protein
MLKEHEVKYACKNISSHKSYPFAVFIHEDDVLKVAITTKTHEFLCDFDQRTRMTERHGFYTKWFFDDVEAS